MSNFNYLGQIFKFGSNFNKLGQNLKVGSNFNNLGHHDRKTDRVSGFVQEACARFVFFDLVSCNDCGALCDFVTFVFDLKADDYKVALVNPPHQIYKSLTTATLAGGRRVVC